VSPNDARISTQSCAQSGVGIARHLAECDINLQAQAEEFGRKEGWSGPAATGWFFI